MLVGGGHRPEHWPPLLAHDMWIEPTTFAPEPGQIVGVRLRVGQDLLGDPLPRDPALINQFVVEDAAAASRSSAETVPIRQASCASPRPVCSSSAIAATRARSSRRRRSSISTLKEEGLDAVAALRARRNETGAKARELFSRCAKSLVLRAPRAAQGDRALGFTLELVAERNPYMPRAGQDLPVRLTYENRPLAGALVVAINRLNPSEKLTARPTTMAACAFD